jgi:glycosyltransferase involved in cell wall biosynthesis
VKVLHIVGGDLRLGAHRGAYWLHQGLLNIGIESNILGFIPNSQLDSHIYSLTSSRFRQLLSQITPRVIDLMLTGLYKNKLQTAFNTGFLASDITKHPLFRVSDVINVHWYSNGVSSPYQISLYNKPTVVTIRDMWPFTGGCHYSMGCEKYKLNCGSCPQLGSSRQVDLSSIVLKNKKKAAQPFVRFVGISEWISNCARFSSILEGHNISTIDNCIDTSAFFAVDKCVARHILGLSSSRPVVVVGASNLQNSYKGWNYFLDSTRYLADREIQLLTFGRQPAPFSWPDKWKVNHLGFLSDEISLRLAYSSADLFVAPSEQEAFGKTIVEAMACATPVVCFDATGPQTIVDHKITGYKAEPFSVEDLARGVSWLLDSPDNEQTRQNCLDIASARFSKEAVALRYKELYSEMIL